MSPGNAWWSAWSESAGGFSGVPLIFWDPNSVFSKRSSCKVLYCLVSTLQFFIPMSQRTKEDGVELSFSSRQAMHSNTAKRNLNHTSVVSFGTRSNISTLTWPRIFYPTFHHAPGSIPSTTILLLGPELTQKTLCCILRGGHALQLLFTVYVACVLPKLAHSPLHRAGWELGQEGNRAYKIRKAPRSGSWSRQRAEQRDA